jgi:hypothetical protein
VKDLNFEKIFVLVARLNVIRIILAFATSTRFKLY